MDGRHIIPVLPANDDGEVVVVEVRQKGSRPLDVRLVGCEGENPYVTTIEHRDIGKLKHKFKGSDEEWEAIVSHFLLQKQPEADRTRILDDVRTVYSMKGDDLAISIQKDVQGIKVILGEIVLLRNEEFEFNPFEWAQASAQAHTRTLQAIADLEAKVNSERDTISKLKAQLEDFIKTKNETETAMLQQFMDLLNEKKRKIRDQSRLLAGAKIDRKAASEVQSIREETKSRKAGPSRASKRKAPAKAPTPGLESDSDQMEIDQTKTEREDEESGPEAATPDRSSDETEDEDYAAESSPGSSAPQSRDKSSETAKSNAAVAQSAMSASSQSERPPPRRELPFSRPATRNKPVEKQPPPPSTEDEETEEEL